MTDKFDDILETLHTALSGGSFHSLILSAPKTKDSGVPRKQTARLIDVQGRSLLQWESQVAGQLTHRNLTESRSAEELRALFGPVYGELYLFTQSEEVIARAGRRGVHIQRRTKENGLSPAPISHDREKNYLIPSGRPCPFLIELGVMTPTGRVKAARQKKFRQINRYLEIVNDVFGQLPTEETLRVIDFGCGLSYLTFAVHHLLTEVHGRQVDMWGIDRNPHVVERCEQLAGRLRLKGIQFRVDDIRAFESPAPIDLAISLHACDTATDDALAFAVAAQASVVLAAPCCQHELAAQLNCESLQSLTRYGVLKDRLAALATDALRAAALEEAGYKTQVLEFIDLEHTPKNLLIRAVKRAHGVAAASDAYADFKRFLGCGALRTDEIPSASH